MLSISWASSSFFLTDLRGSGYSSTVRASSQARTACDDPRSHSFAVQKHSPVPLTVLLRRTAATGTADHADICDAAAKILIVLSCAAGVTPVADTCILTTLSIVAGAPVEGVSLTIG